MANKDHSFGVGKCCEEENSLSFIIDPQLTVILCSPKLIFDDMKVISGLGSFVCLHVSAQRTMVSNGC